MDLSTLTSDVRIALIKKYRTNSLRKISDMTIWRLGQLGLIDGHRRLTEHGIATAEALTRLQQPATPGDQ